MGYVYLICDNKNEYYKIGVTTGKIEKRIKELQTGNGTELFIRDYFQTEKPFKMEKMLHTRFCDKRVLNEWFNLDTEDVLNFQKTCTSIEQAIQALASNPFFSKNKKRSQD